LKKTGGANKTTPKTYALEHGNVEESIAKNLSVLRAGYMCSVLTMDQGKLHFRTPAPAAAISHHSQCAAADDLHFAQTAWVIDRYSERRRICGSLVAI